MEDINLKKYTTFRIGDNTKILYIIKDKNDILNILDKIDNNKYLILGGGSNLLISDRIKEYSVIKVENKGIKIDGNFIEVEAGDNFQFVINTSINNNLKGLEWGSGIPGTIGGAIFGNAGSFGGEIENNLDHVEVFDINNRIKKVFNNKECEFSYRNSVFKKNKNKYIIEKAVFKLNKVDDMNEIKEIYRKNMLIKMKTQPINKFSAGCIFKNIVYDINNKKLVDFMKKYQESNIFLDKKQIPVAFIIDKLGLKGLKINDAEISTIHANFIINNEHAKYKDIKRLIDIIKEKVLSNLGIILEEEIEII